MAYTPVMNVPFKLTPEDMGVAQGLSEAFYKGPTLAEKLLNAQLQNKINQPKAEHAEEITMADLMGKRAHTGYEGALTNKENILNQYLPDSEKARIEHVKAQAGLYGEQAKQAAQERELYNRLMNGGFGSPSSPTPSPYGSIYGGSGQTPIESPMQSAPSQQMPTQAALMTPQQQQPQNASPNLMQQFAQMKSANQNAPYGIQTPQLTQEDLASKKLFGIDNYSNRLKEAYGLQKEQQQAYAKKNEQLGSQLGAAQKLDSDLNRFNGLMDKSLLSGPVGSKIPLSDKTALSQSIDQSSQQLLLSGIELMRNAMGSARFSNLEFQGSEKLKPNRTWGPEAREEYTDTMKAAKNRLSEENKFYSLASNPRMGIPKELAERAWGAYQEHMPFFDNKGNLIEYQPNNWMRYLTPEALSSIAQTGDYNPKDKGVSKSIEQQLTKTERKLFNDHSEEDIQKALEKKRR